MNHHVKHNRSALKLNLNSKPVTGSTLRRRAYAWHLSVAGRRAACEVIFREVSGSIAGPFTASLLEWLSAKGCLGMRILLGNVANQSRRSGLDEAAIFNEINLCAERPLMATLTDGGHLDQLLARMASSRMLDVARCSKRVVLAEDSGDNEAFSIQEFHSFSAACDAVEHREEQAIISRLVADACKLKGKALADAVFARFVEDFDTVTQEELAEKFGISQSKVNRILGGKRNELREALEQEMEIKVKTKTRKPRPRKATLQDAGIDSQCQEPSVCMV